MKVCSRGGVGVHTDYRENIIVEEDHPILKWKANKKNERLRPSWFPVWVRSKFPEGFPYIASQHSEDVLSWNLFCSLQSIGKLGLIIAEALRLEMDIETLYFWQHRFDQRSEQVDPEIQSVLDEMEPWGKGGARQQTETDVILRGKDRIIMVESKLGVPGKAIRAWCRSRPGLRPEYKAFMEKRGVKLFNNSFHDERDGNRFYQLFRNCLLGAGLSQKWNAEFFLLAIVNSLNSNLEGRSHEEEFHSFQSRLEKPGNTFLRTWQQLYKSLPDEPELSRLRQWLCGHPLLSLS